MSASSRAETARSIRALAAKVEQGHPMEVTPGHLRDAARAVARGNHEGARRHLIAAMHTFEPRSLMRHGVFDDAGHARGKQDLGAVHRQYLRVRDIQDEEASAAERKAAARANAAAGKPQPAGRAGDATGGNTDDIPARPIPVTAQLAAEMIDLVGPKGWSHGWVRAVPGTFAAGTRPGSFEHLRAIDDLAERANSPEMAPGGTSPTMRVALHNVAKAIARRDIPAARAHLESAKWANRREAHGMWGKQLADLEAQIGQVPPGVSEIERGYNPLSRRAQHPGKYVPHTGPPANPTAGARVASYQAIAYATPTTDQLRQITAIAIELTDTEVAIELSAKTGMLSTTPHPFGSPGGPGLWNVKGMELPPYIQNIARALLRTGRARNLSHAIAIARAATKRWSRGGGHVSPEVRAASAKTGAEWEAKRGIAHAHATPMELAFNPAELRGEHGRWIAAGSGLANHLHGHVVVGRHASGKDVHGVYRGGGYVAPSNGGPPVKVTHVAAVQRPLPAGNLSASAERYAARTGQKFPPTSLSWMRGQIPPMMDTPSTRAGLAAFGIGGSEAARLRAMGRPPRRWTGYANDSVIELFNPYHAPTGQFTTASGAGQKQAQAKEGKHDARQKRALEKRAASLRSQIAALIVQLHAATAHHRSRSSTPAKKGAAAASAKAAAARTAASKAKSTTTAAKRAPAKTPAQLRVQIALLRHQLAVTLAAIKRV